MKKNLTHIIFILDRSGSMSSLEADMPTLTGIKCGYTGFTRLSHPTAQRLVLYVPSFFHVPTILSFDTFRCFL